MSTSSAVGVPTVRAGSTTAGRSYEAAIAALNSLQTNAKTLALQRKTGGRDLAKSLADVKNYAKRMAIKDDDLNALNAIHVAGSKGKGSTSAMVCAIMVQSGKKTGLYTSPHLIEARERIRIDGAPIPRDMFANYFWQCWDLLHANPSADPDVTSLPTYFRFLTLMAFKVFVSEKVDLAVVEVGLGGRYDATNIMPVPTVSAVTSLGLDHTAILGHTLPEIAFQKAGIFKEAVPAFTVPQDQTALPTLEQCANDMQTPLLQVPPLADYAEAASPIKLGLPGVHQKNNASLALQLCRTWAERNSEAKSAVAGEGAVAAASGSSSSSSSAGVAVAEATPIQAFERAALAGCSWPGRNQTVERGNITYLLDGAHTADSCKACANWMEGIFQSEDSDAASTKPSPHRTLVFNCSGGRDSRPLLEPLADLCVAHQIELALFTPNFRSKTVASADNTNYTMDSAEQLEESKRCQTMWLALLKERRLEGTCRTAAYGCLDECMERVESLPSETSPPEPQTVLITGSLHLVGGVLSVLGCPVV